MAVMSVGFLIQFKRARARIVVHISIVTAISFILRNFEMKANQAAARPARLSM
jgi:hypothetical protein